MVATRGDGDGDGDSIVSADIRECIPTEFEEGEVLAGFTGSEKVELDVGVDPKDA